MRLLLIRHGQTPSNVAHLLDTAVPGPGLTPLGEQQAAALPPALEHQQIDALYASTQLRAQLTAAPLAERRGLDIAVRDGIRELSAGDLEMRGDHEAIETYLTTILAWSDGDTSLRMPGGENGVEALGRFDAVVAEAADTGADAVAMVSHGAAIRTWVAARAQNVEVDFAAGHALRNTGVVVLSGAPEEGWQLLRWEGRPHGPADSRPEATGPAGESFDAAEDRP